MLNITILGHRSSREIVEHDEAVGIDPPVAATRNPVVSRSDRELIASRVDMIVAGTTLEGYKPSWGTWLRFLHEEKPDLVGDPTLASFSQLVVEDLLIVFMCWLHGDDTQDGQGSLNSTAGSIANIGRIMQGLAHSFKRISASTAPFESERVLRVRGTFRPSAREQSLIHDDNETLAASFEMIKYVSRYFFEDLRLLPLGDRNATGFKVGSNPQPEINIDTMGTALALTYSVVCISRVGEFAHTGPAKGMTWRTSTLCRSLMCTSPLGTLMARSGYSTLTIFPRKWRWMTYAN